MTLLRLVYREALQEHSRQVLPALEWKVDRPVRANLERFARALRDYPAPQEEAMVSHFLRFIPKDEVYKKLLGHIEEAKKTRRVIPSVMVVMHFYEVYAKPFAIKVTAAPQPQPVVAAVAPPVAPPGSASHSKQRRRGAKEPRSNVKAASELAA